KYSPACATYLPPFGIDSHPNLVSWIIEGRVSPNKPKGKTGDHLKSAWPLLKELIRPRRGLIAVGFVLMLIKQLCGLVLPGASKFLIDDVIGKRNVGLLPWIVGAVFVATLIQGITSFALTQLLSKEGQRLI